MSQRTARIPEPHLVEFQWGVPRDRAYPSEKQLSSWVSEALKTIDAPPSCVSVRMMSVDEISELNRNFRGKQGPTNVLSFPAEGVLEDGLVFLGDIAICTTVVEDEAKEQHKDLAAHFAHMLIHGVLHLSGFDHVKDDEAGKMEQIEVKIMADFGFPDPYAILAEDPAKEEGNNHE